MPEHQRGGNKSMVSANNNSVSDVVAHVITEASTSSPLARQPIRVINGCRPELQSQVLLNTKTSQPFDDLVKDLAASVRIPKQPLGNVLETLSGRHIRSYSQLRSELRAGQRAFYVYSYDKAEKQTAVYSRPLPTNFINHYEPPNGNRVTMGNGPYRSYLGHKPLAKSMLGKVESNSSSDLSIVSKRQKQRRKKSQTRRRSHSPTPTSRSLVGVSNTNAYSPYS
ncbi:unnamed protein product [Orchesella dallaii]|uniref:Uncharacterized protein n=1 Tax=Orchesella dallaii TaxID=48710 RepID=A0ABP1QUW5_9HEXA